MEQLHWAARFWHWWAALSLRRPVLIVVLGTLAFVASVPFAARLYGDLRTDLRELLPQGAPAAVALAELEKRIGGRAHLAIVVRTDDLKAGERFVDTLAATLKELPPSLVAQVHWRVDAEKEFLDRHGALYADVKDLIAARDALRSQIAKANPLLVDLEENETRPAVNLDEVVGRIKAAYARLDRYPDGYLAGEGGHTLVMLLSPPGAAVSLEDDQRIFSAVANKARALNPKSFHPSIEIGYGGEIKGLIEAQEALVRDLALSSALTLTAVGLALILYYRTIRAVPLLTIPLFTGVALTFALSREVIRYRNPNTAFLGSIIIGNGINAGIILLARYFEERRRGNSVEIALPIALKTTWLGTFAASTAAAASYGSLATMSFRGFNQFGFMGLARMRICWVTTYLLMPPLIAVAERVRPLRERRRSRIIGWAAAPYARLLSRYARTATAASLALTPPPETGLGRFGLDPLAFPFPHLGSPARARAR